MSENSPSEIGGSPVQAGRIYEEIQAQRALHPDLLRRLAHRGRVAVQAALQDQAAFVIYQ